MSTNSENEYYDVCIIGSGPSGAFAAHELSKKNRKVILIEAGDSIVDANPSNVVDVESSCITGNLNFGFSQQVGGSSNLWAGGLARFYPIDLIRREQFGFPGWPIEVDELNKFYERVDQKLGINTIELADVKTRGTLDSIERDSGIESREMFLLSPPFCTKKLVENQSRIEMLTLSSASKLIFSEYKNEISAVEIYKQDEDKHILIKSQLFVLASGALTNIRLLLHSLTDIRSKYEDLYDEIGRYFSTHPKADIGTLNLFSSFASDHPFVVTKRTASHDLRYQFGMKKKVLDDGNLLNHCLRFDSRLNQRLNGVFERSKNLIGSVPWLSSQHGFVGNAVANLGVEVYRAINSIGSFGRPIRQFSVRAFMDQAAHSHNRVFLSDKLSISGLPLATINWKFDEKDWKNFEDFIGAYAVELESAGIGELHYSRPEDASFTGIHSHFLGGTRIGKDAKDSVVDENLKVHGIQNLYVSGPSVFPSFGYTNPFYTISALSIRLADHLNLTLNNS